MKLLSLLILCLILCPVALAQEYPRSEFSAAYSYLRTDSDSVDLTQFGVPGTAFRRESSNLHGWNIGITGNFKPWIGVVADIGGAYGDINYSVTGLGSAGANAKFYSFLFGPQFYFRGSKASGFVRGMVGAVKLDQSATIAGVPFSDDQTAFGAGFGGGVDVRMNSRVSFRALQVDYILTRFDVFGGVGSSTQGAVRISTGFVFRNRD